jgi:hypothetical protein
VLVKFQNRVLTLLKALVLFAPSAWMLLTINPFWRDVDGYNQVTLPPGPMTVLQFSPLYCFGARVPLYLGYLYETIGLSERAPIGAFLTAPILTDSGVFLLIAAQHLGLLCAQCFLLRTIPAKPVTRLILAGLLALNAPFYTYTHSVGAEALSLTAMLLFVAFGFRVWRFRRADKRTWVWFGLSFVLCALIRPLNAVLAMLVPAAFVIQALAETIRSAFRKSSARFPRRLIKKRLLSCGLAVAIALLGLAVGDRSVRYICRASKLKYRSTFGLIFEWRLNFLSKMDETERTKMLNRLSARVADPVVKQMIAGTSAGVTASKGWEPQACTNKFVDVIERSGVTADVGYQLDLYRNRVAKTFLLSREPAFLRAVGNDFLAAFDFSQRELATFPIAATLYCFGRILEMPQLPKLATFRGPTDEAALAAQERTRYYWLLNIRFRSLLLFWAALTAAACAFSKARRFVPFSIALVCTATLMVLLTCFLSELLPRFLLPFWVLFVAAALLSLSSICDRISTAARSAFS